jgi:hypothetical protein
MYQLQINYEDRFIFFISISVTNEAILSLSMTLCPNQ